MAASLDSAPLDGIPAPAVTRGAGIVLRFLALSVLAGIAGGVMQLGVPLLALATGATSGQVGLIRSVAGLGMLAAVLPVGFLVDRFGPGRIFRIGAVVGATVAVAFAGATSPVVLLALMLLEGTTAPLRFTALGASFYGRLATMGLEKAGWFKASMSVGLTLLGPLAGGVLARGAGFPVLFGAVAGVHLAAALLAASGELDVRSHAPSAAPRLRHQVAELVALLQTAGIRAVLGTELLGAAAFAAFTTFVVVVTVRGFGADAAAASRILVVEGLAFVLTAIFAPRFPALRQRLARSAGVAGVAGVLGTAFASGPFGLGVAGVAVGVATGLVHVHVATWIAAHPGTKGRLSALFQTAAGMGVTLGPLALAAGAWIPQQATLLLFAPPFLALALAGAGASRTPWSTMALDRQQIPQYLDATRFIILSTVDGGNVPATRTLASFAADGLTVYFSTGKGSDKVGQIGANANVSILFQHEKQELPAFANVEIRGVAEVLGEGEERTRAIQLIARRNPRFKERAEKGELTGSALVRVTPKKVKVVDFSRGYGPAAVASIEV
jgi:nitroimidazol reductase NimA-like FMN-containing flavoprotein (pyridoxamine 5'-phosphate oxidase superfamily)/MFS family permease